MINKSHALFLSTLNSALECVEVNSAEREAKRSPEFPKENETPWQYCRDYRSVRLDCGQRTGKHPAILKLARQGDCIVTNLGMKELFLGTEATLLLEGECHAALPAFKTIFVYDTQYTLPSRDAEWNFFKIMARNYEQRFVFIF